MTQKTRVAAAILCARALALKLSKEGGLNLLLWGLIAVGYMFAKGEHSLNEIARLFDLALPGAVLFASIVLVLVCLVLGRWIAGSFNASWLWVSRHIVPETAAAALNLGNLIVVTSPFGDAPRAQLVLGMLMWLIYTLLALIPYAQQATPCPGVAQTSVQQTSESSADV